MKAVPTHYMTPAGIAKVNEQGRLLIEKLRKARRERELVLEMLAQVKSEATQQAAR